MKNKILIVEDDVAIAELLSMNLSVTGYQVIEAHDGEQMEAIIYNEEEIDIALVDIMLPGRDGFVLMELFQKKRIPVIYLTAKGDVTSKVKGLRLGAEDYMVKPFEFLELLVRIEKVLERTGKAKKLLRISDVEIDLERHLVTKSGTEVELKPMEYRLLVLFAQNRNIALGREEILNRIWGVDYLGESRTVDVHVGQIRKKLGLTEQIRTIPKVGYRLET